MSRPGEKGPVVRSSLSVLLRDSSVYAIGRIALSALDLLLLPIYTRVLTPDEFGVIALAAAFMAVVAVVSPVGMDAALGRFFFDHQENEREHRASVGTLVIAMAAVALLIAGGMSLAGPGLASGYLDGLNPDLFLILVWTGFFGVFSTLWLQLLQLRRQPQRYVRFALIQAGVRGALTLLLVWSLARGATGWGEAYLVTNLVAGLIAIAFIRKEIALAVRWDVLKDAAKYAFPVMLHQVAGWTTTYASRFILNHLVSLRAVGVFQVGFGIGQVLSLVVTSFNFAYAPRFMAAATQGGEKALAEFGAMATYYLAGIVGIALAVSLFAAEIVAIAASSSYAEAAGLVPIIVATFVLQGAYYLQVNAIFSSKLHTRALPLITVSGAIVNVVATFALVPAFGIVGAAWAGLATNVIVLLGAYALGRRALRIRYDARKITAFSAAAVLLALLAHFLGAQVPHYYQRLAMQLGCAIGYLAVLKSLGIVNPGAIASLVRSFRRR